MARLRALSKAGDLLHMADQREIDDNVVVGALDRVVDLEQFVHAVMAWVKESDGRETP